MKAVTGYNPERALWLHAVPVECPELEQQTRQVCAVTPRPGPAGLTDSLWLAGGHSETGCDCSLEGRTGLALTVPGY